MNANFARRDFLRLGAATIAAGAASNRLLTAAEPAPPAGNEEVRKIMETFGGRGVQRDNTQPLSPTDALKSE